MRSAAAYKTNVKSTTETKYLLEIKKKIFNNRSYDKNALNYEPQNN